MNLCFAGDPDQLSNNLTELDTEASCLGARSLQATNSNNYSWVLGGLGWQGFHCEGSFFRSLFGLLLWSEIYYNVPNCFLTPYQDVPLDFSYPAFVENR
jgi:hypothetical protein